MNSGIVVACLLQILLVIPENNCDSLVSPENGSNLTFKAEINISNEDSEKNDSKALSEFPVHLNGFERFLGPKSNNALVSDKKFDKNLTDTNNEEKIKFVSSKITSKFNDTDKKPVSHPLEKLFPSNLTPHGTTITEKKDTEKKYNQPLSSNDIVRIEDETANQSPFNAKAQQSPEIVIYIKDSALSFSIKNEPQSKEQNQTKKNLTSNYDCSCNQFEGTSSDFDCKCKYKNQKEVQQNSNEINN